MYVLSPALYNEKNKPLLHKELFKYSNEGLKYTPSGKGVGGQFKEANVSMFNKFCG